MRVKFSQSSRLGMKTSQDCRTMISVRCQDYNAEPMLALGMEASH